MSTKIITSHSHNYLQMLMAVALLLCIHFSVQAQTPSEEAFTQMQTPKSAASRESKWFVRVYGSYGLPMANSYRPGNVISSSSRPNQVDYKLNKKGLGQGWRAGAGVGYILNEIINLGIDADYYWSGNIEARNKVISGREFSDGGRWEYTQHQNTILSSDMLTLTPNITFKAISRPSFYVYNRLGVAVALQQSLTRRDSVALDYKEYNNVPAVTYSYLSVDESAYEYQGGITLGFLASLGAQVRITSNIRFVAELQVISMSYSPDKRILTRKLVNGNDRLLEPDLVALRDREIQYVDEKTESISVTDIDRNKPDVQIKERFPYSSIGLSAGLAYRF